ncbi:MAG: ABC transporter ATP-binding protein [Anaerolineae bacterium]|nr:ABC transporter ATP-binding protein [Anaerolineae bacterium]
MPDSILQAVHLYKQYTTRQGYLSAIEDVSFEVAPGEFLCVVGPSGCGKSTLLRLLAGLLEPDRGEVFLHGRLMQGPCPEIGFVFQQANLMPWRTVFDNVLLPMQVQHVGPAEAKQRVTQALELVGLLEFADNYPHELSGGMAQRVAIARALTYEPEILLLDEPFGALDALTREYLNQELMRVWEISHKTVVMVTHNIREAVFLADRVLVLSRRPGRVAKVIPITLPRPRPEAIVYGDTFGALAYAVRQAIR